MLPGLGYGPGGGPVTYGYGPVGVIQTIIDLFLHPLRTLYVLRDNRFIRAVKTKCYGDF